MLSIKDKKHFDWTQKFAASRGLLAQLQERLDYLGNYSERETCCVLWPDSSPYSFYFTMESKDRHGAWRRWFDGGLVFFNAGDSGVGGPQYSVRMDASSSGWSIHT